MNEYVSYEDLKLYLRITDTDGDLQLMRFCEQASRTWDAGTRRKFYPQVGVYYYDYPYNPGVLVLTDDLLEVTSFTTQNTAITLATGDYYLMCGTLYNVTPYDRIAMRIDGAWPTLSYNETPQCSNRIVGIWGYHEDWANAWQAVDTLAAGVTASATTLTVADVDGAGLDGRTPRFKVQQIIKVGTEYMYVSAKVAGTTKSLTVQRGVNGSTAAIQAISAPVSVYKPMIDVAQKVQRLAAWLYGQKDQPYTERIQAAQSGVITIPDALPSDVRLGMMRYQR